MRKPTEKQFAKAHPELTGHKVEIVKHSNGSTVYVRITKDLTRDEQGRVLTAVENCHIIDESLQLMRPYGKETHHVHTYKIAEAGDCLGCVTSFTLYSGEPTKHVHTIRG